MFLTVGILTVYGCGPAQNRIQGVRSEDSIILETVVDEAGAMAWSGQIEGQALNLLLDSPLAGKSGNSKQPGYQQLLKSPARWRGAFTAFRGKLVSLEKITFLASCSRLNGIHRGLLLLDDGALLAFFLRSPAGTNDRGTQLPETGSAITVSGRFLKRWVALNSAGDDYLVMPAIAAGSWKPIDGPAGNRLKRLRFGTGQLPLKQIEAPEVWSRPVVHLRRNGAVYLDGQLVSIHKLKEEIAIMAARDRNPLGDSALAMILVYDPRCPQITRKKLVEMPRLVGARCITRQAGTSAPLK